MGRKKVLERRQARLMAKKAELLARSNASEDVNEVRAINEQLQTIAEDLADIADELMAIAEEEGNGEGEGEGEGEGTRSASVPSGAELRGANPMGAFVQSTPATRSNEDVFSSMEYRNAFAAYVRSGDMSGFAEIEQRDATAGMVITTDVGKIIPKTIMNEFIKNLKSYGQLYNMVRKLNVRGGVEFPIEELVPTVSWITETTTSANQSKPEIKTSVSFGYYIAEARIAQSLLSSIVALDVLESEIARILAEAFIKEFDKMIVSGSGSGQPTGILNDSRVPSSHKITFNETEMADWTKWRTKLFAKIGLAYRGEGVLVMSAGTWETNIMTMKDSNNRPLYTETYNPETGVMECRFNGRNVILVEPDILEDFSSADDDDVFAIYFKPTDYAINSNLQIGFKRYFNDDTNKWVNKGLCILDGKLLDVNSAFILSKEVVAG